ncbi:MAG: SHOCT domain-containing protein [Firmicutes bacterium]|nr:SHOCT domain-containing protein [Bacillota bacterium]
MFVPFYFIYWIYKQTKAADEAHKMRGNVSNSDLAIINLILCVVGLSIVAYALLQDQINKLVTGFTEPPSYARPQNVNNANAQQQTNYSYNFDPMTGEPIRKEAPVYEAPVEEPASEIFTEVPVQESSAETVEVAAEEPAQSFFEEVSEMAPVEEIPTEEAPAEEIIEELPAEVPTEEPAAEDPQVVAEQLENVKMLKQLLDAGVLTQEEFELKKKNILGL